MLRGNTITLRLARGHVSQTGNLFQYDYGQRLILMGVDLPNAYEVHFSNQEHGQSKTMLGDSTGVDIPDEFLLSGDNIHVWIYLHDGSSDGETEYHGIIGVTKRAKPTDQQPTPVQQSVIDQAIAALNAGVTEVEGIAEGIPQTIDTALQEAKDSGEFDGFSPVIETTEITGGHQVSITDATHTESINVMDGEKGEQGEQGEQGEPGHSPVVTAEKSGKVTTVSVDGDPIAQINDGEDGKDGEDGADGYSPTATVAKSGKKSTITITDKNGTTTAEVDDGADGQDGADGEDGQDGFSPVVTVTDITGGHRVTVQDATHTQQFDVMDGEVSQEELDEVETELKSQIDGKADIIRDTVTNVPIASVPDGASNLPLTALVIGIEPVQDTSGGDPSPTNICPITGWTGCNVTRTGKNLLKFSDYSFIGSANVVWGGTSAGAADGSLTLKAGTYTFSVSAQMNGLYISDKNGNYVTPAKYNTTFTTFTLTKDTAVKINAYKTGVTQQDMESYSYQLELGSSATAYEAYQGTVYTIPFPVAQQPVYGGEVKPLVGEGTVFGIYRSLSDKTLWYEDGNYISYRYDFSDRKLFSDSFTGLLCTVLPADESKSAYIRWRGASQIRISTVGVTLETLQSMSENNQIGIYYPLATPTTFTVDPVTIKTVSPAGQNNLWADCGDVKLLTYPCDTKLYIDKQVSALQALILENT